MVDLPIDDEYPSTAPRNPNTKSFTRNTSTVSRQRNGGQGTIRQQRSRPKEGLKAYGNRTIIGKEGEAWRPVEKRFNQHAEDGRLSRDKFGACIGMGDSKEFAGELFDTLARRRKIDATNGITLGELRMFWEDMTNHDTDAWLQIFFDM